MANLFIISGPSGVGKRTVIEKMLEISQEEFILSISCTTRKKRVIEEEGKQYFFISKNEFDQMLEEDKFLEWNEFLGNKYGTPKDFVEKNLKKNKNVVLEIEVNGTRQVIEKCNFPTISIYIMPPSLEELGKRIRKRKTESEMIIKQRILKSKEQMRFSKDYDFVVVNHDVLNTAKQIIGIIKRSK